MRNVPELMSDIRQDGRFCSASGADSVVVRMLCDGAIQTSCRVNDTTTNQSRTLLIASNLICRVDSLHNRIACKDHAIGLIRHLTGEIILRQPLSDNIYGKAEATILADIAHQ